MHVFSTHCYSDGEMFMDCEPLWRLIYTEKAANYIGAQTPFFYIFRERELIYDLFEAATGIAEYQKLITRNPIFLERVEGVGIIGGEEAINWGLSGPMLRASGIQWDLRKVDHYECYSV
ncbi:NADH-plastoquinone oxidoreductase subunit 7 [Tanacetum coccineum]